MSGGSRGPKSSTIGRRMPDSSSASMRSEIAHCGAGRTASAAAFARRAARLSYTSRTTIATTATRGIARTIRCSAVSHEDFTAAIAGQPAKSLTRKPSMPWTRRRHAEVKPSGGALSGGGGGPDRRAAVPRSGHEAGAQRRWSGGSRGGGRPQDSLNFLPPHPSLILSSYSSAIWATMRMAVRSSSRLSQSPKSVCSIRTSARSG